MKRKLLILVILAVLPFFSSIVNADLTTIGTAVYDYNNDGNDDFFNLIYENDQELVWLDFTRSSLQSWQSDFDWASGLGGYLTVNLNPGYTTTIDWTTGWRLPSAENQYTTGFNQKTSEMGHLYYMSLNKSADAPLGDTGPFDHLYAISYWSGTQYQYDTANAWTFNFGGGFQYYSNKNNGRYALAVHSGQVEYAPVPEPATMLLLGSGLIGFAGFRRKFRKR